jgi:cytochrome P450
MSMTTARTIDDLPELDILDAEFAADPYAAYAHARANGWAARSIRGVEILTYDACEAALLDTRFQPAGARLLSYLGDDVSAALVGSGRTLLGSEGADHRAVRRATAPWFTPRRVRELRGATRVLVQELLERAARDGGCEFVDAVARVVPGVVFCWMVGAPDGDGAQLATWSEALLKAFDQRPEDGPGILDAAANLQAYVADLVAAKRSTPGDDVTSMLLAAEASGDIEPADVTSVLCEILAASTDNTMHSAAIQLWLLLEHPEQWDRLAAEPALVPGAVEECGRFEPRVASTPVVNLETISVGDLQLPAETLTWLVFASAHRDPDAFDEPDTFDVTRIPRRGQLSFGIGRHFCLGAALARMELQVVVEALLDHGPRVRAAGPALVDRAFGCTVRELPVTL